MKKHYFLILQLALFLIVNHAQSQNIVDSYPSLNATNVPVDANLSITFDVEMDAFTFSFVQVTIFGSFTGKIEGDFSGVGTNTIIFSPNQDFKPGELVFISATTPLGNYSSSFTTIGGVSTANFDNGQNIITTDADRAFTVFAADLDNDGDMDVLSASIGDNKIAWYENDGAGNFGAQQIITTDVNEAWAAYAADLDNDGDMDVISVSRVDNKVAWYQNDGHGNFGPQQIITLTATNVSRLHISDIDGDGNLDVLCTPPNSGGIYWLKNHNNGNSWSQEVVSSSSMATLIHATDIDNDGNMDIIYVTDRVRWFKNTGGGNFNTSQNITTTGGLHIFGLHAADLDGDSYQDIVFATRYSGIYWVKNNGNGNFEPMQAITTVTETDFAYGVYSADLDGDGDMDVVSASSNDNKIAWYENDGHGNFGAQQIITTNAAGARNVFAADLDGDGDLDVLSASGNDSKIAWYENLNSTLHVETILNTVVAAYPNPAKDRITIHAKHSIGLQTVDIHDISGRFVKTIFADNKDVVTVDLSELEPSAYFLVIKNANQSIIKKIVVE